MGDDRLVDRALAEQLLVVIARVGGEVRVAIDQSRQHGRAAQVDDSGARWRVTRHRTRRADLLDTLALDQDRWLVRVVPARGSTRRPALMTTVTDGTAAAAGATGA